MNPLVTHLEKRGAPRGLGTLIIYLGFILAMALLVLYAFPQFLTQLERLAKILPQQTTDMQSRLATFYERFTRINIPEPIKNAVDNGIEKAQQALIDLVERTLGSAPELLSKLGLIIFVPVVAFYMTMDFPRLKTWFLSWIPERWRSDVLGLMIEIDDNLGSFVRGQLLISAIVGILIAIGLSLIDVDFALIIGLIAGIFNIVPYFGPVIGAAPAIILALLKSPLSAVYVAILFFIVNQVESSIIGPNILGEHIGLHPVTVIFCIVSGGYLFGFLGIILAVPVTSIIKVTLRYIYNKIS